MNKKHFILVLLFLNIFCIYFIRDYLIMLKNDIYYEGYICLCILIWIFILILSYTYEFKTLLLHCLGYFVISFMLMFHPFKYEYIGSYAYSNLLYYYSLLSIFYYITIYLLIIFILICFFMFCTQNMSNIFVKNNIILHMFLFTLFLFTGLHLNRNLLISEAHMFNLMVTIDYIIIWIIMLYIAKKRNNRIILIHYLIFWIAVFIVSLLMVSYTFFELTPNSYFNFYNNSDYTPNTNFDHLYLFIIQLCGVSYFYPQMHLIEVYLIVAFISIVFIVTISFMLTGKRIQIPKRYQRL